MEDGAIDYTVDVCDQTWTTGERLRGVTSIQMVDRLCDVGTGKLDCPATPWNLALLRRGMKIIVRREDGTSRHGGLVRNFGVTVADDGKATIKVDWDDALAYVRGALAYPNPTTQTGQLPGGNEFDSRSGRASTVVLGYLKANIGPGTMRQAPGVVFMVDPLAGASLASPVQARWDNLLDLCREIAIPNGLVFGVTTTDRTHEIWVREAEDRSDVVRFEGTALASGSWSMSPPAATQVIAAGKGEGVDRQVVLITSADSLEQAQAWGLTTQYFHGSSSDPSALIAEGTRQLSEKGETLSARFGIRPGRFVYGRDWRVGDFVTIAAPGLDAVIKPVIENTETWNAGGQKIVPTVGDYTVTASTGRPFETRAVLRVVSALNRQR